MRSACAGKTSSGVAELSQIRVTISLTLVLVLMLAAAASAAVDLQWRPQYQVVRAGDSVRLGLYAVSSTGAGAAMSAMDIIVEHDPNLLAFQNLLSEGAGYVWLMDGFMSPSPDALNESLDDGDMLYTAWAQFGVPAYASPLGLRVTTFEFYAQAPTCAAIVHIPATYGTKAVTRVLDGTVPNLDVKGASGSARVMIVDPGTLISVVEAKQQADETPITIAGPIVTRVFAGSERFYIEDQNRVAGIRVDCSSLTLPQEGQTPTVVGVIRTIDGERVIEASDVLMSTSCFTELVPEALGIVSRTTTKGLIPQGLLVRMAGKAVFADGYGFVLEDGMGQIAVEFNGVAAPDEGDTVIVTGVLGANAAGPVLRVNSAQEIVTVNP